MILVFYRVTLYDMVLILWFWYGDFMLYYVFTMILIWWFYVKLVERGGSVVVVYVFGRKKWKEIFSSNITYKNHHIKSIYKIIIQNCPQYNEDHPTKPP